MTLLLGNLQKWATKSIKNGEFPEPFFILGDNAFTASRRVIVRGDDDELNLEESSLRVNIECGFGELIRGWGILWIPLEMDFGRRTGVIGCCIRLHNYCVNERLELGEDLKNNNGFIGVFPGLELLCRRVNEHGARVDLTTECGCVNCRQISRVKGKADLSRRAELEKEVRDIGIGRPCQQHRYN